MKIKKAARLIFFLKNYNFSSAYTYQNEKCLFLIYQASLSKHRVKLRYKNYSAKNIGIILKLKKKINSLPEASWRHNALPLALDRRLLGHGPYFEAND